MSSDDLFFAVNRGDLESVRRLVEKEGVDVNTLVYKYKKTALHLASLDCNADLVRFLLESNADVGTRDWDGDTPLHMACRCRRNIRVIQLLIDHKVDIKARCSNGMTALHCAILYGAELEVVQCLIDGNTDVNITDRFGRTPLHLMDKLGKSPAPGADVMELLLAHNVDLHVKDNDQSTPLHALAASRSVEVVRVMLDHLSASNDPISIEAALTCRDNGGCLPFHFVENPEMAKLLLERPLLQDEDQVVPRVCHEMLFAKDGGGKSLLDRQQGGEGPLFDYLASFTGLPLTVVPERRTLATSSMACEHRDKRLRHATVPFNPELNEFQRNIANVFLNKWDLSFQQPGTTLDVDREDVHAMLPDDVKYFIMAYLTPADIMKI